MAGEFIDDTVYDNGLTTLDTNVENLYLTSQVATTYTQAITTYKLGTKATPTVGAPEDGATDGRRVIVSAVTDGVVDATGTATHWALTDNSASLLQATGPLSASQLITSGNTFTLDAISVTIRNATVT